MQDLPALLKKYATNTCTDAERAMVDEWLASNASQETYPWPVEEDEQIVRSELWEGIRRATTGKRVALRRRLIYIPAAAACFLLCMVTLFIHQPSLLTRKLTFSNYNGQATRQFQIGSLQFSMQPQSSCIVEVPLFPGSVKSVELCGAVSVVNASEQHIGLRIQTAAGSCTTAPGSDQITLRKGQTYLAMTDREYNLIAATHEELEDGLPRMFSSKLSERFKM